MRTRLLAAMTAAILVSVAAPFLSAAAPASSLDEKCDHAVGAEHKCEKTKR